MRSMKAYENLVAEDDLVMCIPLRNLGTFYMQSDRLVYPYASSIVWIYAITKSIIGIPSCFSIQHTLCTSLFSIHLSHTTTQVRLGSLSP